jgi:hypothetical protein
VGIEMIWIQADRFATPFYNSSHRLWSQPILNAPMTIDSPEDAHYQYLKLPINPVKLNQGMFIPPYSWGKSEISPITA